MGNGEFSGDWNGLKARYEAWWKGENTDGPILGILAPRVQGGSSGDRWVESSSGENLGRAGRTAVSKEAEDFWTDPQTVLNRNLAMFQGAHITADGYPRLFANLGAVSLAPFLGADPIFTIDTIWYKHFLSDASEANIVFDEQNRWLQWSLDATRFFKDNEQGRYRTGIPDITEHIDVLACLFDSQQLLLEIMDNPEDIHRLIKQVQQAWFKVYDFHYNIVKEADGFCNYGPFALIGKGRLAKLQCDMSAMFSAAMFDEFVLPYLAEQAKWLDKSMYHLDGTDAIKHLDSVLSIPEIKALQWTPGAGKPDGGDAEWDFIYDKALSVGKSIYALVHPANLGRFVKRYGSKGVYIVTGANDGAGAEAIVSAVKSLI